jgi:hypothetical protein
MCPIRPPRSSKQFQYGESQLKTMVNISNFFRMVAFLFFCLVCSGCALTQGIENYIAYNDSCNDFVMGWRNDVWARQAWHEQKEQFSGHQEFRAFGAGFRDGYIGVASGGNGCPPPVPPRKYWSWHYQTPEGQCKVAAWFEGYAHGARAAEEDGAGNFQDIQVSYAIEAQYSPEFEAGGTPYSDQGIQFLYGQPQEPTPTETLPPDRSAIESFDPQTHARKPIQDRAYADRQPNAVHPAFYSNAQTPLPSQAVTPLGGTMRKPNEVSRLPMGIWPPGTVAPASFQVLR